ncbi:MAG: pyridoxamine 5'-phosphate oxidase [Cereibacter sphaeroides]|uniref:Pyridoxamine 5'-phosphate oxidase n=1 Tax=Cereibacter sphaeroides TaxID=1063 RepID=A0A2W5SIV4_CERSP|nr:MAG: pyridoxamine 5'-phosphate oxidase [Cereibacter sphaeroides]
MGKQFDSLTEDHIRFIGQQHLYFTGTAARDGRVNISPKGMDSLRVVGPNRILWLNLTGSGNETAPHLADSARITLMWCSFTTRPLILRAYGTGRVVHLGDPDWAALKSLLPDQPGARQIVDCAIDLVQSSCGYAVPFMDFREERPVLRKWAEDKGQNGLREYWAEKNATSIDHRPTGIEANLLQ